MAGIMKTHSHIRADGSIAYFEDSNGIPWSFGFMRRVLESVTSVTDFQKNWLNENRFSFQLYGRKCTVWEPWGDNSRYWVGPLNKESPIDMRSVNDAFVRFRFPITWNREFRV